MVRPEEILVRFLPNEPISEILEFGSGHINNTFKITSHNGRYLLQQVNQNVFHNPQELSANHKIVFEHLSRKNSNLVVRPLRSVENKYVIKEGETFWRLYPFLDDYFSYEQMDSPTMAERCAEAFAYFGASLSDLDAAELYEPIPDFHNTSARYQRFLNALKQGGKNRNNKCETVTEALLNYEDIITRFNGLNNLIPKRIVHNDTKINNLMFSNDDPQDYRIIDLDTMTSDYVLFDFGDMIRTGISPAEEDAENLNLVYLREEFFKGFAQGFLRGYQNILSSEEIDLLVFGAQLITFEQAIRFLTDYLEGDIYYKTQYPDHNLVRTKTQLKLLDELSLNEKKLKKIVSEVQLFS